MSVHAPGTGGVDYYVADVISQSDYYPFGMLMPNRNEHEDGTGEVVNPEGFELNVLYNPKEGYISEDGTQRQSAGMSLLHELAHQYYILYDPEGHVQEYNNAIKSGKIVEYLEKMQKEVGDFDTYSDRWIIQNVENPIKSEGDREDHNSGSFLKTWGGIFSKMGRKTRKPGQSGYEKLDKGNGGNNEDGNEAPVKSEGEIENQDEQN